MASIESFENKEEIKKAEGFSAYTGSHPLVQEFRDKEKTVIVTSEWEERGIDGSEEIVEETLLDWLKRINNPETGVVISLGDNKTIEAKSYVLVEPLEVVNFLDGNGELIAQVDYENLDIVTKKEEMDISESE